MVNKLKNRKARMTHLIRMWLRSNPRNKFNLNNLNPKNQYKLTIQV